MAEVSDESQDLPLTSQSSSFQVQHYIICLSCSFDDRVFEGAVYAFAKHCQTGSSLILDLKDITINSVSQVLVTNEEVSRFLGSTKLKQDSAELERWVSLEDQKPLEYLLDEWSLTIQLDETVYVLVCIKYRTRPEGTSVSWLKDDSGNLCVLTTGSLINNRSLMPCQDTPSLMATWQLILSHPEGCIPLATGCDFGQPSPKGTYFYTSMILPLSTFAIALGKWKCTVMPNQFNNFFQDDRLIECRHQTYPCPFNSIDDNGYQDLTCRVFTVESFDTSAFVNNVPPIIETLYKILGRYLVTKLDFIVVPRSVSCLGFASPGLVLISPSVLHGSSPMISRLGHEISHSWFGINIGPKTWNEEWLSEGFATFMEDVIDIKLSKFQYRNELIALKATNRYQILKSDCQNVDISMQRLSANEDLSANIVVNGLNPVNTVSQIPYLKGYFFLIGLVHLVGLDPLLLCLKSYVEHFHGCLVSTRDCVEFFSARFADRVNQIREMSDAWLHGTSLPPLPDWMSANRLDAEVDRHLAFWMRPKRSTPVFQYLEAMPDQLIALMDRLLECPTRFTAPTLAKFLKHYAPESVNADTYHRACELIVANCCSKLIGTVRNFLIEHPAMGTYLYGELMLSGRSSFENIAIEAFQYLEDQLEAHVKVIIRALVRLSA